MRHNFETCNASHRTPGASSSVGWLYARRMITRVGSADNSPMTRFVFTALSSARRRRSVEENACSTTREGAGWMESERGRSGRAEEHDIDSIRTETRKIFKKGRSGRPAFRFFTTVLFPHSAYLDRMKLSHGREPSQNGR